MHFTADAAERRLRPIRNIAPATTVCRYCGGITAAEGGVVPDGARLCRCGAHNSAVSPSEREQQERAG
jgi:hypothetical protein